MGMFFTHGPHQDAQKQSKTGLPLKELMLYVVPPTDLNEKTGANELIDKLTFLSKAESIDNPSGDFLKFSLKQENIRRILSKGIVRLFKTYNLK
jgi:hypothetical protein